MINSIKKAGIISVALLAILLSALNIAAQAPTLKSVIDRNAILIGEQLNLKITATYNPIMYKVNWISIPDSIAHFEVADRSKIDSSEANGVNILEQTIVLTSFDSGSWKTPAMPISFEPLRNGNPVQLLTDSFPVTVSYVLDSSKNLKDIKPIWSVEVDDPLWYYIIGGVLGLLVIIGAILLYRRLNRKKIVGIFESKVGAYAEAMEEMEKLEKLDLNDTTELKIYHTRLSEIFRRYASRKQKLNLMNRTTGDLLTEFKDKNIDQNQLVKLAAALRCGDAVKFAKYRPAVYESEHCAIDIKTVIQAIEKSVVDNNQKNTQGNKV